MRVLLDTHALLWALREPARLPDAITELIVDPATELVVSAVSAWEISIKEHSGKLPGAEAILLGYREHLERLRCDDLVISSSHAIVAGRLPWSHRDPFDRMLAAQSMVESLPLVSADTAFDGVGGVHRVWL